MTPAAVSKLRSEDENMSGGRGGGSPPHCLWTLWPPPDRHPCRSVIRTCVAEVVAASCWGLSTKPPVSRGHPETAALRSGGRIPSGFRVCSQTGRASRCWSGCYFEVNEG